MHANSSYMAGLPTSSADLPDDLPAASDDSLLDPVPVSGNDGGEAQPVDDTARLGHPTSTDPTIGAQETPVSLDSRSTSVSSETLVIYLSFMIKLLNLLFPFSSFSSEFPPLLFAIMAYQVDRPEPAHIASQSLASTSLRCSCKYITEKRKEGACSDH